MKTNTKFVIAIAIVALIAIGGYLYPKPKESQVVVGAVGDKNSTQRIASCVLDMSTTTPTTATTTLTACLTNNDGKDRIISSVEFYISGLGAMTGSAGTGIATTTWQLATSTSIYTIPSTNASYVLNTTIATSTANGAVNGTLYVASTTPGATATFPYRVWATGTNLVLFSNATSSANAMVGTLVVRYFINN